MLDKKKYARILVNRYKLEQFDFHRTLIINIIHKITSCENLNSYEIMRCTYWHSRMLIVMHTSMLTPPSLYLKQQEDLS